MKLTSFAGNALANQSRVLVDQNAHGSDVSNGCEFLNSFDRAEASHEVVSFGPIHQYVSLL